MRNLFIIIRANDARLRCHVYTACFSGQAGFDWWMVICFSCHSIIGFKVLLQWKPSILLKFLLSRFIYILFGELVPPAGGMAVLFHLSPLSGIVEIDCMFCYC
jgi:hypothetical protein